MRARSKLFNLLFMFFNIAAVLALTFSRVSITPAYAASFSVGDATTLIAAINTANGDGAADTITLTADITLTAVDNTTYNLGTGLPLITSDITIDGDGHTLSRDASAPGFGILVVDTGNLTMQNLTITNGSAGYGGGGIFNANGTVTINNSTFSGNSSPRGGGIYNKGTLTVNNSAFSGNSATLYGGGIYNNNSGTVTVNNSAFSGNSLPITIIYGGGISNSGTLTVNNSTLSGNSPNAGGILNDPSGTLHLRNTLIANSPSGGDCYNVGTIATNLNNLIEDGTCSPLLSGDPSLGALTGSPAYFPLNPDSPAIDAGDAATCAVIGADQRGIARPIDGNGDSVAVCDIGSYEAPISPLKRITAFTFPISTATTINEASHTIAVTVPYGTNPDGLIATFTKSAGAYAVVGATPQVSGTTANNFTGDVIYTVTAADASTQDYTVTVTVAANPAKAITAFSFTSPAATGVITEASHTIAVTVPYGTNVTALIPTISHSGASVSPNSGVAHDFTSPATYTATAADASTQDYVVTVTIASGGGGGPIFADVPDTHWAQSWIERLYNAGITGGCGTSPLIYCPDTTVTRAQMAIFILRGIHGSTYTPPAATGTVFADVPLGSFADAWIEQLAAEGITSGCGGGNYCSDASITRAEMSIFLLRGEHGSAYTPPTATGTVFTDVPLGSFADAWIEQLAAEGVTAGCGDGNYCPDANVSRAQMAVFLVKAFNLP